MKQKVNSTTKGQAPSIKASLKQTTLLQSFSTKNTSTPALTDSQAQPQEVVTVFPEAITPLADESITLSSSEKTIATSTMKTKTLDNNSLIDLTETIDVDSGEYIPKEEGPQERRSPSITIIEDDPISTLSHDVFLAGHSGGTAMKRNSKPQRRAREVPIVITSSSIKVSSASQDVNKPVHPFFMARSKVPAVKHTVNPTYTKTAESISINQLPPFPDYASQHVRGPQSLIQKRNTLFSKKLSNGKADSESITSYEFLKPRYDAVEEPNEIWMYGTSNSPKERVVQDIPKEHMFNHPSIARIVNNGQDNMPISRRPWTEKWRPTCTREVLGNEKSAMYLRNWLRALELQFEYNTERSIENTQSASQTKGKYQQSNKGTKRARVVRAVDKHRKKLRLDSDEEDDDWIVYNDESDEEIVYEELDEFGEVLSEIPASSQSSAAHNYSLSNGSKEEDLGQLHNTMLLSGPSGSGKTASIYACAEELGWDVFEVYPGVGRRNGSNVDNLIGEVGKNHLVLQRRHDTPKLFPSRKNTNDEGADDFLPSYSPRKRHGHLDEESSRLEKSDTAVKAVRQSLILLEEVDILFKEDGNFWTTVMRIIKDCKRPVICTCNDISLVPIFELPLQKILYFDPPPADVATSYLQALCTAEGHSVDRNDIAQLYIYPEHHCSSSEQSLPDLRRAINSLQIRCLASQTHFDKNRTEIPKDKSLRTTNPPKSFPFSINETEFLSFIDANLVRNSRDTVMMTELAGHLPSDDDEIGHTILHDIHAIDRLEFGRFDRQEDMTCTAIEISSGLLDRNIKEDETRMMLCEDRSRDIYRQEMAILKEICPISIWSRGNGSLAIEYLPYVRQMVLAEDLEEKQEHAKKPRVGRSTRNSARSGYVRTIMLTEEARRDLICGGFNIVEGA